MDKGLNRGRLAKGLLATVAAMSMVGVAHAQDSSQESEIVITGSRIRAPNLTSTSPIQAVQAEEFQLQGTYDASNVINTLPQNFIASAVDFSNTPNPLSGPGGVTTANLRGLGPQRTLVLIDGVRLGAGDSNAGNPNPAPNLDNIPGQMIERVDVVTGGASAVYGADAVAGVINFIMKDDFEGVQVDGRYGWATHRNDNSLARNALTNAGLPLPDEDQNGGVTADLSLMFGVNAPDNRGNITAYLSYHRQEPVSQATRDFSACLLASTGSEFVCANSSNSNIFINANTGDIFAVFGNTFIDHPLLTGIDPGISPPPTFNSSTFQYLSRDDTRYSGGFNAHYDIFDNVTAYAQFNFTNDRTSTEVGPSATFQQNGVFAVNCDNPFLSAQQIAAICTGVVDTDLVTPGNQGNASLVIGRRSIEGGARHSFYEHDTYRFVTGVRGDINEAWSFDVYGQYYYSALEQLYLNDINKAAVRNALQVRDVGAGPQCISAINGTDTACRPYNIFADGGVTAEALGYVGAFGTAWGSTEQQIVNATLTGDLGASGVRLPGAEDGVAVAVGVEYRREESSYTPDTLWQSGNLNGAGGATPASSGHYDVSEIFGEIRVPIVQNQALLHDLSVDAGYRYSDYSSIGSTDTYKFGVQWAPTEDLRFRASYQRAVRAPNVTELYVPNYVTNSQVLDSDPCSGPAPTATQAQCANTGVTAAQYLGGLILECPAGQCGVQQGGNPLLGPESSDTYSVGAIWRPRFIENLTISIDWWSIEQEEVIGAIDELTIFNDCLTTGNPASCALVQRTPEGFLFGDTIAGGGWVKTITDNLAAQKNTGIDLQVNYILPIPDRFGTFTASLNGTFTDEILVTNDATSPTYDCAGLFGQVCGLVSPEWRHTLRVTWDSPWDVQISGLWRYIGESTYEVNTNQPIIGAGAVVDPLIGTLDSISYLDIAASWDITPTMRLRGSINNLFDEGPQIMSGLDVSGIGGPNAFPTYDLLGRVFSIGFTKDF